VGLGGAADDSMPSLISPEEIRRCLLLIGNPQVEIVAQLMDLSEHDRQVVLNWLNALKGEINQDDFNRMLTEDYLLCVYKKQSP
jgi:hypothetical protein